jgi:outer membrane protein insertion porin family
LGSWGAGASAQELPPPDDDRPTINSVVIHCDLPRCQEPDAVARLYSLIDLDPGKPWEPRGGEAACFFLERTGLFLPGSCQVTATETADGRIDVAIDTVGQRYIRDVIIHAGLSLESEIEQRIFMRPGQAFTDDDVETRRQEDAIIELFARDGYYQTEVTISPADVAPYLIDLHINIDKGAQLDVDRVYIRGNQAISYDTLRSELLDEFGFFRTYKQAAFDDGLEAIIELYQEAGYINARIVTKEAVPREGLVVDLFVEIREGPRWELTFSGNRHFTSDDLLDELGFQERGYVDEAEIASSTAEIEAIYRSSGYFFAEATVRQEWVGENEAHVTFVIAERSQAEIREIAFEGNETLSSDELLVLLSTREFGLLASGGYLQPEQLEGDIRVIEGYYHELGFLRAHVPRWSIVAEENGTLLYVTIFVDEGPRTTIEEVRFVGNHVLSDTRLAEVLQMHVGEPYGPAALRVDVRAIESAYSNLGYRVRGNNIESACFSDGQELAHADDNSSCDLLRFPEACIRFNMAACTHRTRGERTITECPRLVDARLCDLGLYDMPETVSIEHRVAEGEHITVGEIFIIGNFQTQDATIRRELGVRAGDSYVPRRVIAGQGAIRSLALFNSVSVEPIGLAGEHTRSQVALVVRVEERTSEVIETSLGISSQNTADDQFRMLVNFGIGYADSNFLGRAEELRIVGTFGFDLTNTAGIGDGEFISTLETVYFDPRFYWFDLAEEPWESRTSFGYDYDLLSTPVQSAELAFEFAVEREFSEIDGLFFELGTRIARVQSRNVTSEDPGFDKGFILEISPSVRIDQRDNPINPTTGIWSELRIDLADDFIAIEAEQFTRIQLRSSGFVTLSRRFVLGTHLRFGFALGGVLSGFDTPEDPDLPIEDRLILPQTERFRLGGSAGLRGFPDNGLGPTDATGVATFGDVVLNGTTELRFPLFPSLDVYGAAFLDAGQLAADFSSLEMDGFRFATGLGIRWLAFRVVPVILDYGLVLDRRIGESIGELHFNVGYTF